MRALDVGRVVGPGSDRLYGGGAGGMARLKSAERAARKDADADGTHALLMGAHGELLEILRGETRGKRRARAGIEQVVADLRGVQGAGVDDLLQGGRVAERGDAAEAD